MEKVRLGDVCKIKGGYAFKSDLFSNQGVPIIRIGNITKDGLVIDNDVCYDESFWEENESYRIAKNDILVAMSGATVGKSCVNNTERKLLLNQRVASISCDNNTNLKYIFYSIDSEVFAKHIAINSIGCAQPNISLSQISNFEIPVVCKEDQIRIANELDKITDLIDKRKQQLVKLDELVKARFVELFDSANNSKISKLNDVCEEITAGGDRPKDTSEIKTEEYPYPVFANAATNEGLLCFSREYKVEKPCVTIAARGCTVGFTAIRTEKFTPVVRLISLIPNEDITPIYLKHYIDIKMCIEGNGAAQPQLTIPMIKNMEIMVPPIELQNRFATFVAQTDKSKLEAQKSLEKLELLKKALMQKYFG